MVVLVMGYEDSACKCRGCCDAAAVVDAWWEGGGSSRRASTDDGVQLARLLDVVCVWDESYETDSPQC
jgi:hypothetical protein